MQFLRRMLCWMPEERPVAEELVFDKFSNAVLCNHIFGSIDWDNNIENLSTILTMPRSSLIECTVFVRMLFIDYLLLGFGRSSWTACFYYDNPTSLHTRMRSATSSAERSGSYLRLCTYPHQGMLYTKGWSMKCWTLPTYIFQSFQFPTPLPQLSSFITNLSLDLAQLKQSLLKAIPYPLRLIQTPSYVALSINNMLPHDWGCLVASVIARSFLAKSGVLGSQRKVELRTRKPGCRSLK